MTGLASGARLVVTAGRADTDEAVAVLLAVDLALTAERTAATAPQPRPGWRRAARQEGVGAARLLDAPDLRGLRD